jgi:hypothetical protein
MQPVFLKRIVRGPFFKSLNQLTARSRLKAAPTDESYSFSLSPVSWILTSGSLLYAPCPMLYALFATDNGLLIIIGLHASCPDRLGLPRGFS